MSTVSSTATRPRKHGDLRHHRRQEKRVVSRKFITDGTELDIVIPYGIAIHPRSGDIYVTDAKNYVSSGVLHCYSREGIHKWSVRTGDIPAHMVFLERKQTRQ